MMITLRILSPQGEMLSVPTGLVELPGSQGRFEVLRDHAPLVTSLEKGVIRYDADGQRQEIPCPGGFAEVRNNVVTVCLG